MFGDAEAEGNDRNFCPNIKDIYLPMKITNTSLVANSNCDLQLTVPF